MMTTVAGTFDDEEAANNAIQSFLSRHFNPSQISVLVCEGGECRDVPVVHTTGVPRGAAVGAALGVLGGIVVGPLGLLGIGPVLSALTAVATGTLAGALGGLGFWGEEADIQAEHLSGGAIWVGVETETAVAEAEAALREAGARHVARTSPDT